MTVCPVSTIVAASGEGDVIFTAVMSTESTEECRIELAGAQSPVDIVVYAIGGEIGVTLLHGDGPSAAGDRAFKVPSGGCKYIPVSTGEHLFSDGSIRFRLDAEGPIISSNPMVAVIQRVNTVTH